MPRPTALLHAGYRLESAARGRSVKFLVWLLVLGGEGVELLAPVRCLKPEVVAHLARFVTFVALSVMEVRLDERQA